MEVKIGIRSVAREVAVETKSSSAEVETALRAALESGGLFTLADDKGGRVLIPADKIGYVEIPGVEERRVGFGSLLSF